jgi:periplasmic protein TonB
MFGETLLESSPTARKPKRWPMATAFTVETIVAAVVVMVPLLSTGVIPLSARVQIAAPLKETPLEPKRRVRTEANASSSHANTAPRQEVIRLANVKNAIYIGPPRITDGNSNFDDTHPTNPYVGNGPLSNDLIPKGIGNGRGVKPGPQRIVSVLSEAQLINRVEPVYPKIALAAGVQGEVKLHAIIARDGKIMSLSVISGHPLLIHAAEDAVSQWRYRPYYLNGEPVEVETFITVHFTKGQL